MTLIAANVSLPEPPGVHRIDVETAAELAEAAAAEFPQAHVLLMAAAPADFRASRQRRGQADRATASLDLHLEPTEDILASSPHRRWTSRRSSAFAAEAGERTSSGPARSLTRKGADLIVLNDISNPEIGFESQENAVTLIDSASETAVPHSLQGRDRRAPSWTESTALRREIRSAGGTRGRAILSLRKAFPSRSSRVLEKWALAQLFLRPEYREVGLAHFTPNACRPSARHSAAALASSTPSSTWSPLEQPRQRIAAPLHRPPGRGRPRPLRKGHQAPQPSAGRLLARGFLARPQVPPQPPLRSKESPVSKEIVEAVKALEQEKGISADKLMDALDDALLSAYKKTPGAAKYARVDLDHETGDFRVFELILPPELEEKLLAEAAEAQEEEEREVDPETGRAARARGARARPGDDRPLRGPDRRPATSPPKTSAASPPRPPSR